MRGVARPVLLPAGSGLRALSRRARSCSKYQAPVTGTPFTVTLVAAAKACAAGRRDVEPGDDRHADAVHAAVVSPAARRAPAWSARPAACVVGAAAAGRAAGRRWSAPDDDELVTRPTSDRRRCRLLGCGAWVHAVATSRTGRANRAILRSIRSRYLRLLSTPPLAIGGPSCLPTASVGHAGQRDQPCVSRLSWRRTSSDTRLPSARPATWGVTSLHHQAHLARLGGAGLGDRGGRPGRSARRRRAGWAGSGRAPSPRPARAAACSVAAGVAERLGGLPALLGLPVDHLAAPRRRSARGRVEPATSSLVTAVSSIRRVAVVSSSRAFIAVVRSACRLCLQLGHGVQVSGRRLTAHVCSRTGPIGCAAACSRARPWPGWPHWPATAG